MKKIFLLILFLSLGCSSSKLLNSNHSEKEILSYVSFVLESLQDQGFSGVVGKGKNGKIFVPVKVNGITDEFFIDTGATYTYLNHDHISKYHLRNMNTADKKANIMTWFGTITDHKRAVANIFQLGNHVFSPWPFIVSSGNKTPVIGTDFLHFTNAVLICKYSTMLFNVSHKKAFGLSDSLKKFGYEEFDLFLSEGGALGKLSYKDSNKTHSIDFGTFSIKANFNGIEGVMLIDTGAKYTAIDYELARITGRKIKKQNKIYFIDAMGNIEYPSVIFADSLKVGDYFLSKNRFFPIFKDLNRQDNSYSLPYLGAIGMDYLTRNNAIIDFGNRKLYLIQ